MTYCVKQKVFTDGDIGMCGGRRESLSKIATQGATIEDTTVDKMGCGDDGYRRINDGFTGNYRAFGGVYYCRPNLVSLE